MRGKLYTNDRLRRHERNLERAAVVRGRFVENHSRWDCAPAEVLRVDGRRYQHRQLHGDDPPAEQCGSYAHISLVRRRCRWRYDDYRYTECFGDDSLVRARDSWLGGRADSTGIDERCWCHWNGNYSGVRKCDQECNGRNLRRRGQHKQYPKLDGGGNRLYFEDRGVVAKALLGYPIDNRQQRSVRSDTQCVGRLVRDCGVLRGSNRRRRSPVSPISAPAADTAHPPSTCEEST